MKKDQELTDVLFRVEKYGSILAVFPYESYKYGNYVASYSHIGQHSSVVWDYIYSTKQATPEQYADLKAELESIGYNLRVIKRANHSKMYKLNPMESAIKVLHNMGYEVRRSENGFIAISETREIESSSLAGILAMV